MSRRLHALKPEFVDFMPDELQSGVLYVSMQFKSIQHLCCCGCGRKVVTPLSPTGWQMQFDGRSISLHPSIGNWQKECKSHYLIIENRVHWARSWSAEDISRGMKNDAQSKVDYYAETSSEPSVTDGSEGRKPRKRTSVAEVWRKLKRKLF